MACARLFIASLLLGFGASAFADDFPVVSTEIVHLQEHLDGGGDTQYLTSYVDDDGQGFLVSQWGLTRLRDGHFTTMASIVVDTDLATPENSVRILGASLSPNHRRLAVQLMIADSYAPWRDCKNVPGNDECVNAIAVLDSDNLKLTHSIITSAKSKIFKTLTQLSEVAGEPVTVVQTDPVFNKAGDTLLFIARGQNSTNAFIIAYDLPNKKYTLQEKWTSPGEVHLYTTKDYVLPISEAGKSLVLNRDNFKKISEMDLSVEVGHFSGDWNDNQFHVIASSTDLVAIHQSSFRSAGDQMVDSRILLIQPSKGTWEAVPYRSFIGEKADDIPEGNLLFGKIDNGHLILTFEADAAICRELSTGDTLGYSVELATKTAIKVTCQSSVRDIVGITEENRLPEAVEAITDDTDLIHTTLDGKEISLILLKKSSQIYKSSEAISFGSKTILENPSTILMISPRDKAIFKVEKSDLKVTTTTAAPTTTTTLPPTTTTMAPTTTTVAPTMTTLAPVDSPNSEPKPEDIQEPQNPTPTSEKPIEAPAVEPTPDLLDTAVASAKSLDKKVIITE